MSRLSDFRTLGRQLGGLRSLVWHVKSLRLVMPRKAAFALIFCLSASPLVAQEQSAKATSDKTKEMLERAIARAESAAAVSHQVKEIFNRAAGRWSRFMASMSTAQFAALDFLSIQRAHFTRRTQWAAKRRTSRSNLMERGIPRVSWSKTFAAELPC